MRIDVKDPRLDQRGQGGQSAGHQELMTTLQWCTCAASCCFVAYCGFLACRGDRQGQVSSLWLPSKHRRGHMGELGDGRNEKCHFPRCWADHRLWSGFGGQDRHLPYQWRGWCLPLLYIVMFQGMWSDLSLNESKSAFYGNAFPWNCIPWIFLLFNRVNMPSQQLKN